MTAKHKARKLVKYNIIYIFAIFFFIFQPPLLSTNMMHIIGLLSLIIVLLRNIKERKLKVQRKPNYAFVAMGLNLFFTLIFTVGLNGASPYVFIGALRFFLEIIPFGIVLSYYLNRKGFYADDFLVMSLYAGGIEVFWGILAVLSPNIHQLFADLLYAGGYGDVIYSLVKNRIFGFADGLMYATPVLITVFGIVMMTRHNNGFINSIIGSIFIVIGIINARISIVIVIMGIIVLVFARGENKKRKIVYLCAIAVAFILTFYILLPFIAERHPFTYQWIMNGFEEILLFSKGSKTGYFNYLSNSSRYAIPLSTMQLFFGIGERPMTGVLTYGLNLQSDVGYINDIWYGGIIYIILLYSATYYMLITLYNSENDSIHFVALLFMILLPIINLKGIAFTTNQFTLFIYLLYIIHIREHKERRIKKNERNHFCYCSSI